MNNKGTMRVLICLFCVMLLIPLQAAASTKRAKGVFWANRKCPLYQSKRKETNPGNIRTKPGNGYIIKEIKFVDSELRWIRVITKAKRSPLRWVDSYCGYVEQLKYFNREKPI